MTPFRSALAALVLATVIGTGPAQAQTITFVQPDRLLVGLALGRTAAGDPNQPDSARDFAGSVEIGVTRRVRARLDAGVVKWAFSGYRERFGLAAVDDVTTGRLVLSLVKSDPTFNFGAPMRAYLGGGIGVFRYDFSRRGESVTTGGIQAIAGLEVAAGDRVRVATDAWWSIAKSPDRNPLAALYLHTVGLSLGIKMRF